MRPTTHSTDSGISSQRELVREIQAFLLDKLSIQVESTHTDLLEAGVLDSVAQVDLLVHIEERFRLHLPMEDLELDSFRSVANIAELIISYSTRRLESPVSIDGVQEGRHTNGDSLGHANASEVQEGANLIREIKALLDETLSVQVDAETNLFETGLLDSMTLVQFILSLEERFKFNIPMEDIEVESFRSATKIAELVASRTRNNGLKGVR